MKKYDVVITVEGRKAVIGETTHSLAQARRRFKYAQQIGDGRRVDIVKDGELIETTDPEDKAYLRDTRFDFYDERNEGCPPPKTYEGGWR